MKKLTLLFASMLVILGSCEKSTQNLDKSSYDLAYLKHNTYVAQDTKSDESLMPELLVTKVETEELEAEGRVFCKSESSELIAGQNIPAGDIIVSNDAQHIYVTYRAENGWKIKEIHLYVGTLELLPVNKHNVPVPGQFPVKETFDPPVEMVTYEIPIGDFLNKECPIVAAHAVVVKDGQEETAWGKGNYSFEGELDITRWGWLIEFCPQDCKDKELTISLKSYVVDPATCSDGKCPTHLWWAVSGGEHASEYCFGVGTYTYSYHSTDATPEEQIYLIYKDGNPSLPAGTIKVSKLISDSKVVGLNVLVDIDDNTLKLSRTFLYVGTLLQFNTTIYDHEQLNKECPNWYLWPFYKEELADTHLFTITF